MSAASGRPPIELYADQLYEVVEALVRDMPAAHTLDGRRQLTRTYAVAHALVEAIGTRPRPPGSRLEQVDAWRGSGQGVGEGRASRQALILTR